MRLVLALSAVSLLVVGCSSESKFVGQAKKFKDKMCACTSAKCVSDVQDERRAERKKMKGDDTKMPSEGDIKKLIKISEEYNKCKKTLMEKHGAEHPRVLEIKKVADEVCACKDVDCAKAARKKLDANKKWVSGIMKHTRPLRKKISKCYMDLLSKPRAKPPATPPATPPAKK